MNSTNRDGGSGGDGGGDGDSGGDGGRDGRRKRRFKVSTNHTQRNSDKPRGE